LKTVALIGGLLGLIAEPVWAGELHCQADEQIIFSCSFGKKMVSVCASNDFSVNKGYLQYRFGLKGAPELATCGCRIQMPCHG